MSFLACLLFWGASFVNFVERKELIDVLSVFRWMFNQSGSLSLSLCTFDGKFYVFLWLIMSFQSWCRYSSLSLYKWQGYQLFTIVNQWSDRVLRLCARLTQAILFKFIFRYFPDDKERKCALNENEKW